MSIIQNGIKGMQASDKYVPVRLIGKGSFGQVYLVRRKSDGSELVMKRINIAGVQLKELESYHLEVNLLSQLEHPGIVSLIESFEDREQCLCIVMGYCEGGDLGAFLKHKRNVKLSEAEVTFHFVQMALALAFMHEKNILHRDLKTQNIFIKNGLIQLGDFGISKVLGGSRDFAQTCIGTPYYMSPELFKNKPYNHKSDVWALGCVLYEMATLKHAFDSNSINGLAQKILKGIFLPISPIFSKPLRDLIKSMLGVAPSSRPSIRQIITQPFIQKHVKRFVATVLANQGAYKPICVQNLIDQIQSLGMHNVLIEIQGVRASPLPESGIPSVEAVVKEQDNAVKVLRQQRNKEYQKRLAEIATEDEARKKLEKKLAELKAAHEAKKAAAAERMAKVSLARQREQRVALQRAAEVKEEQRKAAEMANRQRVLQRKQLDAAQAKAREKREREKREYEAEKARKEQEADERSRQLAAMQERKRQEQNAHEKEVELKRLALEARVANERAELEKIRLQREYLAQRLKSMDEEQNILETAPLVDKLAEVSGMSAKDRVLYEKRRRQQEAEEQQRLALLKAREQAFQDHLKAIEKNRQMYSSSSDITHPRPTNANAAVATLNDNTEPSEDEYEDDFVDEHSYAALDESTEELDAMQTQLMEYTRNIQLMRNDIEVRQQMDRAGTTEENNSGMELQSVSQSLEVNDADRKFEERIRILTKECVKLVGKEIFRKAYTFLRNVSDDDFYANDLDDELKLQKLTQIMGAHNVKHWHKIDEIIFLETAE